MPWSKVENYDPKLQWVKRLEGVWYLIRKKGHTRNKSALFFMKKMESNWFSGGFTTGSTT
jgi:hypothetical protein